MSPFKLINNLTSRPYSPCLSNYKFVTNFSVWCRATGIAVLKLKNAPVEFYLYPTVSTALTTQLNPD